MLSGGIGLHDLSQYARPDQTAAERRFGFDGNVSVLTVADGSPARAAGIRPGDSLLAINDQPLPPPVDSEAMSIRRSESARAMLDEAGSLGSAKLMLKRRDSRFEIILIPVAICQARYLVMPKGPSNAWTDGRNIAVAHDLLRVAADDDELAAVLAHELSHIIARGNAAGPPLPAKRRAAEAAADRLSVRILIDAGYDPRAAIRLWSRLGARDPFDFLPSATHGSTRSRIREIAAEIAAIASSPSPLGMGHERGKRD